MLDHKEKLEKEEIMERKVFQVQKDPRVQMEIVDQKENQEMKEVMDQRVLKESRVQLDLKALKATEE